MPAHILVAEDQTDIRDLLVMNLRTAGYEVSAVGDGEQALARQTERASDLLILDLMMPRMDGLEVCKALRARGSATPILMLTAKSTELDRVLGLELGADDYLTKPFELAILIARIRGLLRRREWLRTPPKNGSGRQKVKDIYSFGEQLDKTVDFDSLELRVGERVFHLTLMEANLLRHLIEHEGKPVSRKTMLQEVWSLQEDTDTRPIDNFIVRLRRYIEDDPTRPRHFVTVRGVGYRFVAAPGSD